MVLDAEGMRIENAPMIHIRYEDHIAAAECSSIAEVEAKIDALHEQYRHKYPICAVIEEGRFEVNFGLGADPSFVSIQVAPFDGEVYISCGDAGADGWIDFYGVGGHTPYEARTLIPFAVVKQAVLAFLNDHTLSKTVNWCDWDWQPVRGQPWDVAR